MSEKLYDSSDLARWHARGMQDERERAACAEHEHKLAWGRTAGEIHRDRKAEMMRTFAVAAERFHELELGRPYREYKGGPIDWETGELA